MTSSTDQTVPAPPAAGAPHVWRPAGVVYLAASLAALTAGAFPELFLPEHLTLADPSLRALEMLAAAQAGFVLLLCPSIVARRQYRSRGAYLAESAGEFAVCLVGSAPLYVAGAWLSGASAADVAVAVGYLASAATAAWALGLWTIGGRGPALTAAALAAAAVGLGGPVAVYLLAEMAPAGAAPPEMWAAFPVTCAFGIAGGRAAPAWAWGLWPAVAAILALARLAMRPRPEANPNADLKGAADGTA